MCKLYAIRIVFIYWFSFLPFLYQITLSMIVINVYYDVWITWDTLGCVNTFVVFTLLVFSIVTIECSVVRGVLCVTVLGYGWIHSFCFYYLYLYTLYIHFQYVIQGYFCGSLCWFYNHYWMFCCQRNGICCCVRVWMLCFILPAQCQGCIFEGWGVSICGLMFKSVS
jgi:hypothetical protein